MLCWEFESPRLHFFIENKGVTFSLENTVSLKCNALKPLFPETVKLLKKILRTGNFFFYTRRGNPYIQTVIQTDINGNEKYTTLNLITTKFSRLIKKTGLDVPKATGFYLLRRTAATMEAKSGDSFAVQRLPCHADLKMATRYVQDVSAQTDRAIEKSRMYICRNKPDRKRSLY